MIMREPAPDGGSGPDGRPVLVIPAGSILKGGYRVSFLTAGGMSVAYRGERDGKLFFIKEVDGADPKRLMSLTQEKFFLERLNHPGIIKVLDFFDDGGYYYLVTEFIEGADLSKQVSPTDAVFIGENVVLDWALQLCDILEYLHGQSPPVIYRDLKPQNVIRDGLGRLHLVDFGIARSYKEHRKEDTDNFGTVYTSSPEHFGVSQTDERSDIFSLGATLHYLLTNGRGAKNEPFQFTNVMSINPRASESLARVIQKSLEMSPAERYQSVRELRQALLNTRDAPLPLIEPLGGRTALPPRQGVRIRLPGKAPAAARGAETAAAPEEHRSLPSCPTQGAPTADLPGKGRLSAGTPSALLVGGLAAVALLILAGGFVLVFFVMGMLRHGPPGRSQGQFPPSGPPPGMTVPGSLPPSGPPSGMTVPGSLPPSGPPPGMTVPGSLPPGAPPDLPPGPGARQAPPPEGSAMYNDPAGRFGVIAPKGYTRAKPGGGIDGVEFVKAEKGASRRLVLYVLPASIRDIDGAVSALRHEKEKEGVEVAVPRSVNAGAVKFAEYEFDAKDPSTGKILRHKGLIHPMVDMKTFCVQGAIAEKEAFDSAGFRSDYVVFLTYYR